MKRNLLGTQQSFRGAHVLQAGRENVVYGQNKLGSLHSIKVHSKHKVYSPKEVEILIVLKCHMVHSVASWHTHICRHPDNQVSCWGGHPELGKHLSAFDGATWTFDVTTQPSDATSSLTFHFLSHPQLTHLISKVSCVAPVQEKFDLYHFLYMRVCVCWAD